MRSIIPALILAAIVASSCQWTPDRDNPHDPESPLYMAPPPRNQAPEIDQFYLMTNCRALLNGDICDFELICKVSDADFNVNPSAVAVFLDDDFFDFMYYNSVLDQYFISGSERDLPLRDIDSYINHPFQVIAVDDSGASDTASFQISAPFRHYPTIFHPVGYVQVLEGTDTVFAWFQWNGIEITGFDVVFRYLNDIPIPDLEFMDIPPTDTTVVVNNYPFIPSNDEPNLYTWYVTAKDLAGNTATSFPGTFYYIDTTP